MYLNEYFKGYDVFQKDRNYLRNPRPEITNFLRNSRPDPKNGVSYKNKKKQKKKRVRGEKMSNI